MNIESLIMFCDVVGQRSFSRAAEANGMSQSGASQMVHHLEDELGLKLIDRSRRPFILTSEGEIFYNGCRQLVEDYQALRERLQLLREEIAGRVRVASIYSVGLSYLKQAVREFETQYPKAEVRVIYEHPERVYEMVESDQADLGLVSFPRKSRHIAVRPWRDEVIVLACATGHPLANREAIQLRDLEGVDLVGFDSDLPVRQEIDRALAAEGIEANVVMELDNIDSIKRAVEVHDLASLLPEPSLQREVAAGVLRAVPLAGGTLRRPLGIIARKGKEPCGTVERFQRLLLERVHDGSPTSSTSTKERKDKSYSAAS